MVEVFCAVDVAVSAHGMRSARRCVIPVIGMRIDLLTTHSGTANQRCPSPEGGRCCDSTLVPSARFERAHTAPEADALSPELRGRGLEKTWEKTPGHANFGAGGMLADSSAAPTRLAGEL